MKNSFKNTWELFKLDWKRIYKNKLTFALILALMVIPSLYAWFNIAALWDPYSNTKDISIAVYSDDKTAEVMGKEINIGDKIIDGLHDNDKVGWRFVDSKEELDKGVKSGKYYGGVYLPEDFSEHLVSFVGGDIKKPEIEYSVNQKINAIAPKITDKGASGIQDQITKQFIATISEGLVSGLNEVGVDLDSNIVNIDKISNKILDLDDNMDKIDGYTKEVIELNKKMPEIKGKLDKANEFTKYMPELNKLGDRVVAINGMMPTIQEKGGLILEVQDKIPEIQNAAKQVEQIDQDFDKVADTMNDAISEAKTGLDVIGKTQEVLPNVEKLINDANAALPDISNGLNDISTSLPEIASGVGSGLKIVLVVATDVQNITHELAQNVTEENKAEKIKQLVGVFDSFNGMHKMLTHTITVMQKINEMGSTEALDPLINQLTEAQGKVEAIMSKLSDLIENAENLSAEELQVRLEEISKEAASIVSALSGLDPEEISRQLSAVIEKVQKVLGDAENITNQVIDNKMISEINGLLANASGTITEGISFLEKYQAQIPEIKQEIHDASMMLNENMDTIVSGINKAADLYQNDLPNVTEKMGLAAGFIQNDLPGVEADVNKTMGMVNEKLPLVESALDSAQGLIENEWPNIQKGVSRVAELIREGRKDIDFAALMKLLKADAKAESDFLASPVLIDQHDIYPVPNNGSASAPFYTALCLWVGAVLFSSIASTEFHLTDEQRKKYSKRQQFLARMATFLVVSFFQALIVALGNYYLLGTYAANPVFAILFAIVVGLVFMVMVYVLVALFGNLGKGAAVIILVLSISGGGGNYPIEMSGKFFQMINPLLPFTHAVNLLREPVGGIYWPNAIKALVILLIVGLAFFIIGVMFFPQIQKYTKKLNDYLKKGHILH
ncbi:YhgE/Pip domain-containing protein [Vagococcus coleopterorum]|uniref:YhgE/Pip domain-containing protein n=1 Tax=Vagococcus coleopterorum TaxID=2714946 RepID=A0A6G8APU6_9ENTE|nr:YhgE/Pip domain-containing protein [Vagococcus coleopterorum]QIL47000.1 YhgE/Pip domain-containing protein [Vagococcus coleopterorum]